MFRDLVWNALAAARCVASGEGGRQAKTAAGIAADGRFQSICKRNTTADI